MVSALINGPVCNACNAYTNEISIFIFNELFFHPKVGDVALATNMASTPIAEYDENVIIISEKYTLHDLIGEGSFGAVFKGVDISTNMEIAAKVFKATVFEISMQNFKNKWSKQIFSQC